MHDQPATTAPLTFGRRTPPWRAAALLAATLAVAACGGSPTGAANAPIATAAASAQTTPVATADPTPTPAPTPIVFVSKAYGYALDVPLTWLPGQARQAWDGTARIDSNGPYVDAFIPASNVLFFVYGAPTDLSTEAYAAQGQAQVAEWHGCPATADAVAEVPVDGTPGELHEFTCQGLLVQKLMVVRDGQGLVLNMLAPPAGKTDPRALFRQIVAGVTWPA